jgi:hypothetical protein
MLSRISRTAAMTSGDDFGIADEFVRYCLTLSGSSRWAVLSACWSSSSGIEDDGFFHPHLVELFYEVLQFPGRNFILGARASGLRLVMLIFIR